MLKRNWAVICDLWNYSTYHCVSMLLNKNINQLEELNPDVIND